MRQHEHSLSSGDKRVGLYGAPSKGEPCAIIIAAIEFAAFFVRYPRNVFVRIN